ncbi:MFS transporter [Granulicoccus sp. GXG6511]|uniref:MFS transporter n=1 Tax=Granulicoccus sp. GXG6511 TaxID=3381351 RepID=UPI003D7E4C4C
MSKSAGRLWPLYLGGFLGPFGSPIVTTMVPELAREYDISVALASTSVTSYLIPFAMLMLMSGTFAERWGRKRTVQLGYVAYALTSIGCALAPNFEMFTLFRILMGASNAFTTPVLVAAITDLVPREKLGRSLGMFGAMQATGQAMSPLAGGVAADLHWSLAFYAIALVAFVLAALPPDNAKSPFTGSQKERWKALANGQLAIASIAAALSFFSLMVVAVIGVLYLRDEFGTGATVTGLILAIFGITGLLTGRWSGSMMDRYGQLKIGGLAHLVFGLFASLVGVTALVGGAVGLGLACLLLAVAGSASTATRAVVQQLAVTSAPANRSGATSVMLACQFGGAALAPILWMPIYEVNHVLAMLTGGAPAFVGGLILLLVWRMRGARPAETLR